MARKRGGTAAQTPAEVAPDDTVACGDQNMHAPENDTCEQDLSQADEIALELSKAEETLVTLRKEKIEIESAIVEQEQLVNALRDEKARLCPPPTTAEAYHAIVQRAIESRARAAEARRQYPRSVRSPLDEALSNRPRPLQALR